MRSDLFSKKWVEAADKIRKCHVSTITSQGISVLQWVDGFNTLFEAIQEERLVNKEFAKELSDLTTDTEFAYDFKDVLEEYFDLLEDHEEWEIVLESAQKVLDSFLWFNVFPSEYKYRIGNALQQLKKFDEALAFGKKWLEEYPNDLYAAASNVFLLVSLNRLDEAEALTEKYLTKDLICTDKTQTIFLAAELLFDKTNNSYAKERVAKKIAEYNAMIEQ